MGLWRQGECTAVTAGKRLGRFGAVRKFVHGLVLFFFQPIYEAEMAYADKMQSGGTQTG